MKPWMWAIVVIAIAGPAIRYLVWLPARHAYRWLWVHMPEGKLKQFLLKKRGAEPETWPKLPPGP